MMPLLWALCKATKCNISEAEKLIQEGKVKSARNKEALEKKSKCSSISSNKSEVILQDPPARINTSDGNCPLDLSVKTLCKSVKRRITTDSCEKLSNCHGKTNESFEFTSATNSDDFLGIESMKTNVQFVKKETDAKNNFSVASLLSSPDSAVIDETQSNFLEQNSNFLKNNFNS